jgi:hypothetical protein
MGFGYIPITGETTSFPCNVTPNKSVVPFPLSVIVSWQLYWNQTIVPFSSTSTKFDLLLEASLLDGSLPYKHCDRITSNFIMMQHIVKCPI